MLMCVMAVMLHVDLHASVVWSTPRHACVRCSDKATPVCGMCGRYGIWQHPCAPARARRDGRRGTRPGRASRESDLPDHADCCAWSLGAQRGPGSCRVWRGESFAPRAG